MSYHINKKRYVTTRLCSVIHKYMFQQNTNLCSSLSSFYQFKRYIISSNLSNAHATLSMLGVKGHYIRVNGPLADSTTTPVGLKRPSVG